MKATWVWLLVLEIREWGPVSGYMPVVHDGIPESLQGVDFHLVWQVRVTLFCWPSNGACPRVLKSTSTKKVTLADILANKKKTLPGLFSVNCEIPPKHLVFPTKIPPNFFASEHVQTTMHNHRLQCVWEHLVFSHQNPSKTDPELLSMYSYYQSRCMFQLSYLYWTLHNWSVGKPPLYCLIPSTKQSLIHNNVFGCKPLVMFEQVTSSTFLLTWLLKYISKVLYYVT